MIFVADRTTATSSDMPDGILGTHTAHPSTGFQQSLKAHQPYWLNDVIRQVRELLMLQQNWDSRGAQCIDPDLLEASVILLSKIMRASTPPPCMIPVSSGGVQIEWHMRGMDLEVEFRSTDQLDVFYEDHLDGNTWEDNISFEDLSLLEKVIAKLTSRL